MGLEEPQQCVEGVNRGTGPHLTSAASRPTQESYLSHRYLLLRYTMPGLMVLKMYTAVTDDGEVRVMKFQLSITDGV